MNENLQFLRQRIEHEDNLVNQRLSWLVGSQSFLITAFAISLNAPTLFYSPRYVEVHQKLLYLLPIVAIASILVLMLTLIGAVSALAALRRSSDRVTTAEDIPVHSSTAIRWLGLSAAFGIPVIFLVFWTVLIMSL